MKTIEIILSEMYEKLHAIENKIDGRKINQSISDDWISREKVMEFFDYGATQIAALQKNDKVVVAKVGKRIFFNRKSILQVIEDGRVR